MDLAGRLWSGGDSRHAKRRFLINIACYLGRIEPGYIKKPNNKHQITNKYQKTNPQVQTKLRKPILK